MDFTAIDFETANHRRDSACQLAVVVVREGQIVDRNVWLIRPRPLYFSPRNIDVHGIRPDAVKSKPEFGDLWELLEPYFQSDCIVAHNAPFDIGVLRECLRTHDRPIPRLQFTCTRLIARATWPGRGEGYGLKKIAEWLGIEFRHHDALEDSIACAKILLAAAVSTGSKSLDAMESKLKLSRGWADATEYQGAKRATRSRARSPVVVTSDAQVHEPVAAYEYKIDIQRLFIRAEFLRRLAGKRIVISGELKTLSREHALQLASKLGATIEDRVTTQTDVVVINDLDQSTLSTINDSSQRIQRLTEHDFIGLVQ